jgi:hypothetical protein
MKHAASLDPFEFTPVPLSALFAAAAAIDAYRRKMNLQRAAARG